MATNNKPKRTPTYSTEVFERAHQAPGMSHADRAAARAKGLLREDPPPRKSPAKARGRGTEPEPRRGRQAMKSRHLRFPEEIDQELQALVEHFESTMVGVLKALIHDEWLRVRREALRAGRAGETGEAGEASAKGPSSG